MSRPLELKRDSLFEAVFYYRGPRGETIDLTGLVDDAEFTILMGEVPVLTKSVLTSGITALLELGRFDLLILEADIDQLDFQSADYRFRIHWLSKGWHTLGNGRIIFDD